MEVFEPKELTQHIEELFEIEDLREFKDKFLDFHPFEQSEMFNMMTTKQRKHVVMVLSPEEIAPMYEHFDIDDVLDYLSYSNAKFNAKILEHMSIDDAVNILRELDKESRITYISLLPRSLALEVNDLMQYDDFTAGALMTTSYIEIYPEDTVKEAMKKMVAAAPSTDNINNLFVTEKGRLVGVLTLKELIIARAEQYVSDVMNSKLILARAFDEQNEVAKSMKDYDLLSIPVVDKDDTLLGIITIDDIVDVIEEESIEDYSRFAAISDVEIDVNNERVMQSVTKRIPWLIALLVIGVLVSTVISSYEHVIAQIIVLSFFMTTVLDMAGNTGTQSLAVAVRGLSTEQFDSSKKVIKHLARETMTGLVNGLIIAVAVFGVSYLFMLMKPIESYGLIKFAMDPMKSRLAISAVISVSMVVALTVSTLAGALIPLVMAKFKIDPAVASGPFITTINDIIGLSVYFSLAAMFLL